MNQPDTNTPERTHPDAPAPKRGKGSDAWIFFRKFLRYGTGIASVTPSSRWMSRKMIDEIDFSKARCIVELGAGTGPVTAEILRRKSPECRLLVVERDPDFCERLRQKFPQAEIILGDATDFEKFLDERGIEYADHVISGLPTPSLPPAVARRLFEGIEKRLAPGGMYRQLTVMPWVFWRYYKSHFEEVSFKLVPLNIPPGGVYVCRKLRELAPAKV